MRTSCTQKAKQVSQLRWNRWYISDFSFCNSFHEKLKLKTQNLWVLRLLLFVNNLRNCPIVFNCVHAGHSEHTSKPNWLFYKDHSQLSDTRTCFKTTKKCTRYCNERVCCQICIFRSIHSNYKGCNEFAKICLTKDFFTVWNAWKLLIKNVWNRFHFGCFEYFSFY